MRFEHDIPLPGTPGARRHRTSFALRKRSCVGLAFAAAGAFAGASTRPTCVGSMLKTGSAVAFVAAISTFFCFARSALILVSSSFETRVGGFPA